MDSSFLTKKIGPLPFWAWAGILAVGLYIWRRQSSSASTATTATTTASTGVAAPTETLTTSGGTYTGPVNAAPSSITNPAPGTGATSPGNGGSTPGQTSSTTTTVPTTVPNTVAGPSTVDLGGQSLLDLGSITGAGGQYFGYNVGGGAPVEFQTPGAGSAAQLAGPGGISALPVGTEVYTPASDAGLVSSSQVSEKL